MPPPLFHRAYGADLACIPAPILRVHDIGGGRTWRGEATIGIGPSLLAKVVCAAAGLPPAADTVPVTVEMTPDGHGESWRRRFGSFPLDTTVRAGREPGTVEEKLGAMTATLRLAPDETGVRQIPERYRLFGISLPKFLWPELDVRESAEGGIYRFKVAMRLWGTPIQSYEGWLDTTAET